MNLEMRNWYQLYERFLRKYFPAHYEKILDYIDILKNQSKVSTLDLNKIGRLTGETINFFLAYLLKEEQIEVDMVSGYFFHGKSSDNSIFKRNERNIRQFCIKNADLINNKFDAWRVLKNI